MDVKVLFPEIELFESLNNQILQTSIAPLKISRSRRRRLKRREKLNSLMEVNTGNEVAGKMMGEPHSPKKPSDLPPQPSVLNDGAECLVAVRERADLTVVETQGMERPWPEKKRKLSGRPYSDLVEGYPYNLRPRLKD